jgi:Na+:H+ antiporter, NhaA family
MHTKTRHAIKKLHPKSVVDTFPTFLRDEAIGGKLIFAATVLALLAINSPLQSLYENFWLNKLTFGIGDWTLSHDLRHWINEGLMAIFFLVVGLEIKRELVHGELKNKSKALLPIAAAAGGMVVPAILYITVNNQPGLFQGWGIPIATDIAFAVAVLSLLSKRVPNSLKIFLLTLAIADDIGAIFVIALFYAEIINYWYLALSAFLLVVLILLRSRMSSNVALYLGFGAVLWLTTHLSGIHASIVGAMVGLIAPATLMAGTKSTAQLLEDFFLPISTFIIVPLFAFANAGVVLSTRAFNDATSLSVMIGIVLGLVIGKVTGILGASWLMVRFTNATLPVDTNWRHIAGVGFIAGIGFTVSIFITELAFRDNMQLIEAAKIGIFIASIASAVLGVLTLLVASRSFKSRAN